MDTYQENDFTPITGTVQSLVSEPLENAVRGVGLGKFSSITVSVVPDIVILILAIIPILR